MATFNPIKMILQMSPDRKIVWVLVFAGIGKVYDLDKWIPMPDNAEEASNFIIHANEQVQELAEEIRQQTRQNDDSVFSMIAVMGSIIYVILKKVKEILGIRIKVEKVEPEKSE